MNQIHYFKKLADKYVGRKVGLIIPPSPFLLDERVFVSLGVLRVAASLEAHGVNVSVLDLSGVTNFLEAVKTFININEYEWVGITSTTPQLPAAVSIAKCIKSIRSNLKIVLGGPHVTLTYSAVKVEKKNNNIGRAHVAAKHLEQYFDTLISGDGEISVFEAFKNNSNKFVDADDHKGQFFMSDEFYDSSELPARHLVDLKSYHYNIDGYPATSLIAQLGCPFNCGFCGGRNSKSLRLIRKRTTESIITEIKYLYEQYGYTGFMFYDDELNVNKNFTQLLQQLIKLQENYNIKFRFRGFVKAELFTEEQAELMYRAGFRWVLSGFEAAHHRILRNIEKIATLEDNTRVVELSHKYGLKVKALMSVGHPGESVETILSIRDWLINTKIDDFDCTIITTYPGTPYYDLAVPHNRLANVYTYTHKKTNDRLHSIDIDHTVTMDYYKGDPNGGYKAYVFTDYIDTVDLVKYRNIVEHDVREALNIPYNQSNVSLKYEHSMGMGLPEILYKQSLSSKCNKKSL